MHTKFFTALAAASLLTIGSVTAALAEAADIQASANGSATAFEAGANPSRNASTDSGFAPTAGFSAHYHPHGTRQQ